MAKPPDPNAIADPYTDQWFRNDDRLAEAKDDTVKVERLSQQQFDRFRDFIYEQSGIRVHENKLSLLTNRIRRRLKAGDFEDFDVYYRFLTSPEGALELGGFLDAITTNETFFFRTEKQFEWLKTDFLSEVIAEERAGRRAAALRIWSAGCATGAEPYSVAICLAESSHRLGDWSLEVVGTDISEEALRAADHGLFGARAVEGVTEKQKKRCFLRDGDQWKVRPAIRQLVHFQKHNLMQSINTPAFDCIFIRNVLIYFDRDSKRAVIRNLVAALAVGGYLVVGPSEGVYDMLDPLEKVSPLLYRKVNETLPPV